MTVFAAVQAELESLGDAAVDSVEGQTALSLAAVLDDRAGVQAGGSASTAKQLLAVMDAIRERYAKKGASRLALLRGESA